jgi:hypothetical protein
MDYLESSDLLPPLQSGFRRSRSTETAVLQVLSDILQAVDHGDVAALVLLDLSAAFDTVDHEILLQCLQRTYGIVNDSLNRMFSGSEFQIVGAATLKAREPKINLRDETVSKLVTDKRNRRGGT